MGTTDRLEENVTTINTTMRNYTESHTLQISAYIYDRCGRNGSIFGIFDIDWIAVSIVCCGAGWVLYQQYQPRAGKIFLAIWPLVRAVTAIACRIAIDLARFLLTILGIVAEILLELSNKCSELYRRFRAWILKIVDEMQPVSNELMLCWDTVWHSRFTNHFRQRWRAFRELLSHILFWGVLLSVLWVCLQPNLGDKEHENDNLNLDVRRYTVPVWVIKARPENRPRDGSSSHYMSEDDWALLRDFHAHERHDFSVISISSGRPLADVTHSEHS